MIRGILARGASGKISAIADKRGTMSYVERLRRAIGHGPILNPGVRAVIRDEVGRILLGRRGDFGTWDLPAGGMELGETIGAALRREVREETGLNVVQATPFGIYSDPACGVTYPNGDQVQPVTLAFLVEEWSGTPIADGDETRELAFFAPDALPPSKQIHPPHRKTLLDFQHFLTDWQFIVD